MLIAIKKINRDQKFNRITKSVTYTRHLVTSLALFLFMLNPNEQFKLVRFWL